MQRQQLRHVLHPLVQYGAHVPVGQRIEYGLALPAGLDQPALLESCLLYTSRCV